MSYLDTHLPHWPKFRPRKLRERTLALLRDHEILTEHGELLPVASYAECKAAALDLHADILVDDVRHWEWLEEAAEDTKEAKVNAVANSLDDQPRAVSVTWRVGNRWAAVVGASKWGRVVSVDLLTDLRALCDHLEVGTFASPGALGQATMKAHTTGRYKCPCLALETDIRDNLIGGRAEMMIPPKTLLDEAYETDRTSAYIAEAKRPLPVGSEVKITSGASLELLSEYGTWYHQMTIFRPSPVRYSSFGVPSKGLGVTWPTAAGWYENVWLWSWQLGDVLAEGCLVVPGPKGGWAWRQAEPILAEWADWIYGKRTTAPTPAVADLCKLVMVAAVGSHLQSRYRWTINARDEGKPIHDKETGLTTSFSAVATWDGHADLMPHWSSTILHGQQLALYVRQSLEELSGNTVLMTNFDSLLLAHPSTLPLTTGQLGGWRQTALGSVYVVAERSLVSASKIKLPGVTGGKREETAIEFAQRLSERKQIISRSTTGRYLKQTKGEEAAWDFIQGLSPEAQASLREAKGDP